MSLYSPYVSAGQAALARMLALPTSNIAGNFRPLGTGAGFTLGNIARGY